MEPLRIGVLGAARISGLAIAGPARTTGDRLVAVAAGGRAGAGAGGGPPAGGRGGGGGPPGGGAAAPAGPCRSATRAP